MKDSLDFIYREQKELSTFSGIAALLGWDQMTYMPSMGPVERSSEGSVRIETNSETQVTASRETGI